MCDSVKTNLQIIDIDGENPDPMVQTKSSTGSLKKSSPKQGKMHLHKYAHRTTNRQDKKRK